MPTQKEFDSYYLDQAEDLANRFSKARRKEVGAILTKDNRPLVNGYNGTPSGMDNNCEYEITTYPDVDWPNISQTQLVTKPDVIHAEKNIIGYAAKHGIPTDGATVYVTLQPCMDCCTLMYIAGVRRIVYREDYRDPNSIDFCKNVGILIEKF